jgi:hypothetical protein
MLYVCLGTGRDPGRLFRRRLALLALAVAGCTGTIGDRPATREAGGHPPSGRGPSPGTSQPMPGPTGSSNPGGPTVAPPMGCGFGPRRIWVLTPDQYGRSVSALLPAERTPGARIRSSVIDNDGFSNNAGNMAMTEPHVTEVLEAAVQLADAALATAGVLDACLSQPAPSDDCLRGFVGGFTGRAFRRDLDTSEIDRLVTFTREQAKGDLRAGLKQYLVYLFASPQFLFRTELGSPETDDKTPITLTAFEKASALSYFLIDGPPDGELLAAARAGLDGPGLEAQARRLLASSDTSTGLIKFVHEQFQTDAVLNTRKDPMTFTAWTDALAADLSTEADSFVRQVLWHEGGRLSTLLGADFSMLNGSLARYYGAADPAGVKDFHKVTFKPGERAGLVTQAGLMAAQALDNDTSPVRRGLYVRQALLCQSVPDPPPTINVVPPMPDGKRQQRERLALHSTDPTCAICHGQMDPIGLGFESYDGVGRYRTADVGRPLDNAGELTGVASPFKFANAVELLQGLAKTPEVDQCFLQMAFTYGQGRDADPENADKCVLDRLSRKFTASGGNVVDLAAAIVSDETFFVRR